MWAITFQPTKIKKQIVKYFLITRTLLEYNKIINIINIYEYVHIVRNMQYK